MKNSHIQWTDHTFNPWIGCTKVSPGCAHCYAEALNKRWKKGDNWGKGAPRVRTSATYWKQPIQWNEQAAYDLSNHTDETNLGKDLGPYVRPRVFSASLADWLDDEVCCKWFLDLLRLIHETPNLDWLLLTKRPENWQRRMIPALNLAWGIPQVETPFAVWVEKWLTGEAPANVWIGTTVEDQARGDERIPHLLSIPAKARFLSCEPLLESVKIEEWLISNSAERARLHTMRTGHECGAAAFTFHCESCNFTTFSEKDQTINWVICGGESGPGARPMHPAWARSLRDQCAAAGVPFHFKQWGEWQPYKMGTAYCDGFRESTVIKNGDGATGWPTYRVGKTAAGRLLDGIEHNGAPAL